MELQSVGMLVVGVALGMAVMAWLTRSKIGAQVEAALSKETLPLQTELSELRERVRALDATGRKAQEDSDSVRRQADSWRAELDSARDEISRLDERARRVPFLESQASQLNEELKASTAEVRNLSGDCAQKGEKADLLGKQVDSLLLEKAELEGRLNAASQTAAAAGNRIAGLEEQAGRLPLLEEKLSEARTVIDRLSGQLTELRETSSAANAQLQAARELGEQFAKDLESSRMAHAASAEGEKNLLSQLSQLRESSASETSRLSAALKAEQEAHSLVREELQRLQSVNGQAEAKVLQLTGDLTELRTRLEEETKAAAAQQALLLQAKESLSDQFKSLASDILEEKSKRFAEQNHESLGQLLTPLKHQLTEFKGKVEEVYFQEGKDRSALSEQVRQLLNLNQTLSHEAKNLTLALKGNTKTQGNWGELVLERVLEASGLRKGQEYHVQESQTREDGSRAQADVVINLPEERRLVVDSKVSLLAYEAYVSADNDEARGLHMKRHLESVRGHIKGLSAKEYQLLYGLKSLDFVLMFVPLEPAFMLAVTNDSELFMDAWNKNVLLVSPSTLLFVVRMVAHLWRQEAQSNNAQEIAKRGAELYDKLCAFVSDLENVGTRLRMAQEAYDNAHKKLSTGRGNTIRQAEKLRELGVKPSKSLASGLVEKAIAEDDIVFHTEMAALTASDNPQPVLGSAMPLP